jgi:hypothetical protein
MKLSIATYYKPTKITKGYGLLYDENGDEISERERGLDGKCEVGVITIGCYCLNKKNKNNISIV